MDQIKKHIFKKIDSFRIFIILSFTSQLLFSLIFTVNLLYHVSVAKLNPMQLILVGTILELSVFLFEIPTGIVADTKSRKLSIVIGYVLMGLGFILEGLLPIFFSIAIAQVLWGIGYTFTSGAIQAWITDEVGEEKAGTAFVKGAQWGQVGELIAIPISILIGLISINIPIIFGGIFMILLALFLAIKMQEHNFKITTTNELSSIKSMLGTIKTTAAYIKGKHVLILLLTLGIFYGIYSEGFDRLWTAHLIEDFNSSILTTMNPLLFFGTIRVVLIIFSIIALEILHKKLNFKNPNSVTKILVLSAIVIILALVGFSLINNLYVVLALFWVIGIMRSISGPLLNTWLNSLITNSNIRATVFSVRGQLDSIGQIGGGPFVGFIGNMFSIRIALFSCAIILSPILYIYFLVIRKKNVLNLMNEGDE